MKNCSKIAEFLHVSIISITKEHILFLKQNGGTESFQISVCSHNAVQALKLKTNHDAWDWLACFAKTAKLKALKLILFVCLKLALEKCCSL